MLGLLLPYAPLQLLLLDGFGGPLVMTSANRLEKPIVYRSQDAVSVLANTADRVLANDREIVAPCDDSVAIVAPSGPILLRRSCPLVREGRPTLMALATRQNPLPPA